MPLVQILVMTAWQVIEEALSRKRPVRNATWLAEQLGIGIQSITNWKARGVPQGRYVEVGAILGLTAEQLAGVAPLPWEKSGDWPFPDIDRARFDALTDVQRGEIQGVVRRMLTDFENERNTRSGKSSGSQPRASR